MSRQRYGQDPAESQKDGRNNDYKSPAVENKQWEKNISILKKINLKKLTFKKHLCQNPNLQIFSWRSPKEKDIYPIQGQGEEDNCYCILKTLSRPGHS